MSGRMRQRALGENEILAAMLRELSMSSAQARVSHDQALSKLDEMTRNQSKIEAAARKRASAEFSNLDPALFANLMLPMELR